MRRNNADKIFNFNSGERESQRRRRHRCRHFFHRRHRPGRRRRLLRRHEDSLLAQAEGQDDQHALRVRQPVPTSSDQQLDPVAGLNKFIRLQVRLANH